MSYYYIIPKINNGIVEIPLADDEYNEFLKIIKKV